MKKFLIVGNGNAVTYKEIFLHIKNNEMWVGYKAFGDMAYIVPDGYEMRSTRSWRDENGTNWRSLGNACWFTNMHHAKRDIALDLCKKYNPTDNPKYDNYDAVNVSKTCDIPCDYDGVMGVPITFLGKYCPDQFEIIGHEHDLKGDGGSEGVVQFEINGKGTYARILIRRKR